MPTYLESLGERHALAEKTELLLLQREQRRYEALLADSQTRQLFEDAWASQDPLQGGRGVPAGLGSAANDLMIHSAIGWHNARPGARRDGGMPPFYRTEMEHWRIVDAARTLEAFCPTAVCILDVLTQFCIFTGYTYTIVSKEEPAAPEQPEPAEPGEQPGPAEPPPEDPTVTAAQEYLDKWMIDNNWYSWELELFRRSRRDGEAFLILDDDDGELTIRSIEPEQVKEPADATGLNGRIGLSGRDASWRFGILTHRDNTSKPLAYWVVSQYSDTQLQGTLYDAEDVFHLKTEWVDRQSKRGVSDFFSVANDLPGVKKLLRNLREGATVQAGVAWIEEMPEGIIPSAMGGTVPITTRTGQQSAARVMDGPEVLRVLQGHKYTAGPLAGTGQSETLIQVLQAALRNIGARWQMPEGLVSGDASNANLASALVAEGPFTRALEARQWYYKQAFKRMIERVLDRAAARGEIPGGEQLLELVEVSVETPAVIARKKKEETEMNQILAQNGILSPEDWAAREDLDWNEQQAKIAVAPLQPMEVTLMGMQAGPDEGADKTEAESEKVT